MICLTRVTLASVAGGPAIWLRFGRPMYEDDPDAGLRHVYFAAGTTFARMECHAPDCRRLAVLRAAGPGERVLRIAGIEPGAQVLLYATTTARTEQALQAFVAIDAQGIPLDEVNEDYWRVLHQRLITGIAPPAYTAAEHTAVRQRRGLRP